MMKNLIITIATAIPFLSACGDHPSHPDTDKDSVCVDSVGLEYGQVADPAVVDTPASKGPNVQPSVTSRDDDDSSTTRFYEKGYQNGYDDGEEDASTHSGWQTDYDDGCDYRGWKQSEYENGYAEGYEAGYDDYFEEGED